MSEAAVFAQELLQDYKDDRLLHYIKQPPPLVTTVAQKAAKSLLSKLVAKSSCLCNYRDEVQAVKLAGSVGVRVPSIRRVVHANDDERWLIMDRVQGLTLEQLWPNISWWTTFSVALQLGQHLRRMHDVTSQSTGGIVSGKVQSEWIQGWYEPIRHSTPIHFTAYLNWWLTQCHPEHSRPLPELRLDPQKHHVLVHQDLAPRNMILDDNGRL